MKENYYSFVLTSVEIFENNFQDFFRKLFDFYREREKTHVENKTKCSVKKILISFELLWYFFWSPINIPVHMM